VNIALHVARGAERDPNRLALIFEERTLTYAELDRAASRLAEALGTWGLVVGDRIALFLPNVPEFMIACLGAQKFGAVVVSLNSMLKSNELEYALADCGAIALFTTADALEDVERVRASLPELRQVVCCVGRSPSASVREFADVLSEHEGKFVARELPADAPAAILYTSGTTGQPKGAVLTHGNLESNSMTTAACVGARTGDRHILYLPLSHCFGQNFIMHTALRSEGTIVLQRRYQLEHVLADIAKYSITHFYGVPTNYIYLLDAGINRAQFASVRYCFSAAATMPHEIAATWFERMGALIHEGYGLTETSPLATYNHLTEHRAGSVGTPIEGVELRVVDASGNPLPNGQWGEICIKGPNVMAGYYRREAETREAIRDGWFHSGDIGYRDDDGYYYLVDRLKDMINCAGFKVWPREVEEVLYQHPSVAECAVVGVPDALKGERAVAFVRLRPGAANDGAALSRHCDERLARYKIPSEFIFDREIPKSPSGKILKRVLRG
jgi:long-chain acyl-CoA synthetase